MATAKQEFFKEGTIQVNFVCQRCCQPLRLDTSFNSLNEKIMAEFSVPQVVNSDADDTLLIPSDIKTGSEAGEDISRRCIPPVRLTDSGNGFMLVGETNIIVEKTEYQQNLIQSYLFDILSDNSDVDHPLCEDCTDTLLDLMDAQLKVTEDECKDYREYLEEIEKNPNYYKEDALEEEWEKLKSEEEELRQHLQELETQQQETTLQLEKEHKEQQQLDRLEYKYWEEYSEYKRQLLEYEDEQKSVDNQLRYAQAQLDKLKKTNVFNATFHIWHSGHFGTINNFRLGRLPSVPVDWNEINAAWGQTVLLLNSLAQKMNLKFQRYRLVPYGNHSFLESLTDKSKELPLYGSGGFRFFWDTKFDQAMVSFLDCLQQFKEEVEKGDTGFCLPYKMDKGKIDDGSGNSYSIKIQFNSEEQWTKALKFMLTNLKWGLAWVSSQFSN